MASQPTRPWLRLQRPSPSQSQSQTQPTPLPSVTEPVPTPQRPSVIRPIFRPNTQPARPPLINQPPQAPTQISRVPSPPPTPQIPLPPPRLPSPPATPQIPLPPPRLPSPPEISEIPPALPPISGVASPPASPQIRPPPPLLPQPQPQSPITSIYPNPVITLPPPPSPIVTTPVSVSPKKPFPSPLHNANREAPDLPLQDYPPRLEEPYQRPPSPLYLPSAKLPTAEQLGSLLDRNIPPEAEQKSVLYQKKTSGNNGKEQDSRQKKVGSNGDGGVRVITLAGENRGAFMEIIGAKHRGNGQGVHKDSHVIEGRGSKDDGKKQEGKMADASPPMRAYANSNVQGINNSIILSSSCNYHDPGVHLSFSRKPVQDGRSLLHRSKEPHTHEDGHLG